MKEDNLNNSQPKQKGLIIACGGTGGHLFPGISIADYFNKKGNKSLLFISKKKIDKSASNKYTHLNFESLPGIGFTGFFNFRFIKFIFEFIKSIIKSYFIIKKFTPKPIGIISMGGFTSLPPLLVGKILGIPTYLHESNSIAGKANKINALFCDMIFIGMKECEKSFKNKKLASRIKHVGMPIRTFDGLQISTKTKNKEKLNTLQKKAIKHFSFESDDIHHNLIILVTGGSQGASGINKAVKNSLKDFSEMNIIIIHICGINDINDLKKTYSKYKIKHYLTPFMDNIELAYSITDLVVSRSGASSLSELAYLGLPSILIPYPYAAENHQQINAEVYSKNGAAIVIKEKEFTTDKLSEKILNIFYKKSNPEDQTKMINLDLLHKMSSEAKKLDIPNSAQKICDIILE